MAHLSLQSAASHNLTARRKEIAMNWDQVAGKLKEVKGRMREKFGKLTVQAGT